MGDILILVVLLVIVGIGYEVLLHSGRLASLEVEIAKLKSKLP